MSNRRCRGEARLYQNRYQSISVKERNNMPEVQDVNIFKNRMHELRREVDAVIVKIKDEIVKRPAFGIAEVTLAYRSAQLAKMWLGKALEESGSLLPPEFRDNAPELHSGIDDGDTIGKGKHE